MGNHLSARAIIVALCALITAPTLPATQNTEVEDYTRQVDPTTHLARLLPEADAIGIAVAVVPDPLVPRYRRLYDHAIVAIELGMLRNGYVLDRFYLPWNQKLRSSEDSKQPPAASNDSNGEHQTTAAADPAEADESAASLPFHRGAYGLLLFRCDAWRHVENPRDLKDAQSQIPPTQCGFLRGKGTRFRALYIVTDVSTKGVETRALQCVMRRIASQLPHYKREAGAASAPDGDCWPWHDKITERGEANEHQQHTALASPAAAVTSETAAGPEVGLMSYPVLCKGTQPSSTLLILGPSFSGAVDSFAAASERLAKAGGGITDICLVSSSATDETNIRVNKERYLHVRYSTLALDDRAKVLHIMHLVQTLTRPTLFGAKSAPEGQFGGRSTQVAVLYEASTFGNGVCNTRPPDPNTQGLETDPALLDEDSYKRFCDKAIFVPFPANIADIRYGLQEQREQQRRDATLKLPATSEHLSLELGAENGSEYPDSRQSALTSVSTELAMEQILDTLKAVDPPPRFVVVVATDVRDRLFLFDELRGRLPGALLIDLEADNLLGHPDFLHASRGALATASVNLTPWVAFEGLRSTSRRQPLSAWSSDWQRLIATAVRCMTDAETIAEVSPAGCVRPSDDERSRQAAIQVVTLEGFKPVSSGFVPDENPEGEPTSGNIAAAKSSVAKQPIAANSITGDRLFGFAEYGAPLTCLGAALLWVFPLVFPAGAAQHSRRVFNIVSYAWCAAYAAAVLRVAWIVHEADYDNSVLWWTVAMLTAGFAGLQFCLFKLRHASEQSQPKYFNVWVPALLASAAIVMALTPLRWLATMPSTSTQTVDINALVRLGLDPDSGLAFLLLVANAAIALLYASVVLATAAAIVNRNSTLLRTAESGFRPPRLTRRRGTLHMNPFGLLIAAGLAIAATVLPNLYYNNVRLTVFGQFASLVALAAITATTCCAALLACSGVGAARRIIAMSQHILLAREAIQGPGGPGLWPLDGTSPCEFPTTPVVATVGFGANLAKKLRKTDDLTPWIKLLREWIYLGTDGSQRRVAVFTLLATEMSLYQWSIAGAVVCTLASVGAVYLFPIEADRLLLLNLLMLVVLGVGAGYMATAFERNELLCTVLCNRHRGRQFSAPLFACICIPFVVFAVAVAIANVPGVVDWGGGFLQLLKALGFHA